MTYITYNFDHWYKESLDTKPEKEILFKDLYENYKIKCIKEGIVPIGRRTFATRLQDQVNPLIKADKVRKVNNKGIKYQGLTLIEKKQES